MGVGVTWERKCTRGSVHNEVQVDKGPCTREVRAGVLYRGVRDRALYRGTGDQALTGTPLCEQTHITENITFLQILWQVAKMSTHY